MQRVRHSIFPMIAAAVMLLVACSPPDPVRIGFLGGLSMRVTDLGTGGLNGVRLAVDLRNKKGGIRGRPIELIEEDDQQDPEVARQAVTRLIDHNVAAIIGPMTSAMAVATLPLINRAQVVMISPTVSSNELSRLDDYFFRVSASTRHFAHRSAEYNVRTLGLQRIQPICDQSNRSYTESWLADFSQAFSKAGGKILAPISFSSGKEVNYSTLAQQALAEKPDGIILLSNSVDAAMFSQSIRRINPSIPLGTSEWAATERLVELGGRSVEGMVVAQLLNRNNAEPSYVAFRENYTRRFRQEPGFSGLYAFDAANIIFDALEKKAPEQALKQALLSRKTFQGTLRTITLDDFGDTQGETNLSKIKDGVFVPLNSTN